MDTNQLALFNRAITEGKQIGCWLRDEDDTFHVYFALDGHIVRSIEDRRTTVTIECAFLPPDKEELCRWHYQRKLRPSPPTEPRVI